MTTLIKWNVVNKRAREKCLPEDRRYIIFWNDGIYSGKVWYKENGECYVDTEFSDKKITTGFIWCYQDDLEVERP